jgi:hypothetical protein
MDEVQEPGELPGQGLDPHSQSFLPGNQGLQKSFVELGNAAHAKRTSIPVN